MKTVLMPRERLMAAMVLTLFEKMLSRRESGVGFVLGGEKGRLGACTVSNRFERS